MSRPERRQLVVSCHDQKVHAKSHAYITVWIFTDFGSLCEHYQWEHTWGICPFEDFSLFL